MLSLLGMGGMINFSIELYFRVEQNPGMDKDSCCGLTSLNIEKRDQIWQT